MAQKMRHTCHLAESDGREPDAEHRYSKESVSGWRTVNLRIDNITQEVRTMGAVVASMTELAVAERKGDIDILQVGTPPVQIQATVGAVARKREPHPRAILRTVAVTTADEEAHPQATPRTTRKKRRATGSQGEGIAAERTRTSPAPGAAIRLTRSPDASATSPKTKEGVYPLM